MAKLNFIEDSFVVCANCKWSCVSTDDIYYVCLKSKVIEHFSEEITEERYKATYNALEIFRAENNGKCPYFEKRFSLLQKLKNMLVCKKENSN